MEDGSAQVLSSKRFVLQFWLPLAVYVALIFTFSAQPHLTGPLRFENGDKLEHLAEYFGLGVLMLRLASASRPRPRRDVAALVTLLMGMAIAATDERFQKLIPGRQCDLTDWLADSLGVALAQVLLLAWDNIRRI